MGTQAQTVTAKEGWRWLTFGFTLFKKNPAGMLSLTVSYFGVVLFLSLVIPFAGSVLAAMLSPGLNAGMLTACRMVARGLPITPSILFSAFLEENKRFLKPFLRMGSLYALLVLLVSLLASSFGSIDMDLVMQDGKPDPGEMMSQMVNVLAVMAIAYLPVMMLFWYAPALLLWHEMSVGKALFFSFLAVWRNRAAFLIYATGWFLWLMTCVSAFTLVSLLLPLPTFLSGALNFIMVVGIFSVTLCTFYPSYLSVFEPKELGFDGTGV